MKHGIDIVKISRFEELKNNEHFLNSTFTEDEIAYILKHDSLETIASLYSSKEAFLKAIKKGINSYSLKDIEVIHDIYSAPMFKLHNELDRIYDSNKIALSISHDGAYCVASVIIY